MLIKLLYNDDCAAYFAEQHNLIWFKNDFKFTI